MKVSLAWLKQLIDLKASDQELINLLPLRTIGVKEVSPKSFELDMKGYNRADLLSMRGVAYEVAAITDSSVTFDEREEDHFAWNKSDLPASKVTVKNQDLCPLYCLAKIENLSVQPSAPEWVEKLNQCGARSVNNLADVTNLIMLEYGQPLHAFDAEKVAGRQIIVRLANDGEEITTIDGKKRLLSGEDLVISDPKKSLAIAGIMGGKDSQVNQSTTTILLEAAIFHPSAIRKTGLGLGLSSEASKRFQHGLGKKRLLQALNAAIGLYLQMGGKLTALTIIDHFSDTKSRITLTQQQINSLIGIPIDPKFVFQALKKLHFAVWQKQSDKWEVAAPYWRLDVSEAPDVIEEIARLYGYEKIPAISLSNARLTKSDQSLFELIRVFKNSLVGFGLCEVQTYSFYSSKVIDSLEFDRETLVRIANPISSETEYLRERIWPNLLQVVAANLKRQKEVAVFELGKTYQRREKENPSEEYHLSLAISTPDNTAIQQLYQVFKKTSNQLRLSISLVDHEKGEGEQKYFHPHNFSFLGVKKQTIGGVWEIHPRLTDRFDINQKVAVLEIEVEPLVKLTK